MTHKINISGIIGWDVIAADIKEEFKNIGPTEEVDIELNSPGGSVFEGIEISNAIKSHKGKTNLIITSFAASMGSYIAMSADHVSAYEDSTFMIHNASTIEWGDHRALRKTANVIESLSKMLSKAYTNKTGKENSEIRGMMDDETWLFGEEIINAGFIDELIESEESEEKEDAVAFQKLVFMDSIEKMKGSEKTKTDIDKLAAYFNNGGQLAASAETSKDLPGKPNSKKEESMTLIEFLAANPTAQAEYDKNILTAKTTAATETKTELAGISAKVGTVIMSSAYGEAVKKAGLKVLSGEKSYSSFEDMVALSDEFKEKAKSKDIQNGQPPETPGEPGQTTKQQAEGQTKANAKSLSDDINNTNKVT